MGVSYWSIAERYEPYTWGVLSDTDFWKQNMYREWDMGGIIFSLSVLSSGGWSMRLKQKSRFSRIKIVFEKDDSIISFRSEADMFKNRKHIDYDEVFAGMWQPQMTMIEQTSRRITKDEDVAPEQPIVMRVLKNPHERSGNLPCILDKKTKTDIYGVYGNKGFDIICDVESGKMCISDVELLPKREKLSQYYPFFDANKIAPLKMFDLDGAKQKAMEEEYPIITADQSEAPHKPTVKDLLSMLPTQDLLDEVLSRKDTTKRRRKPEPITPDNVVRIENFIKRIEVFGEEDERRIMDQL